MFDIGNRLGESGKVKDSFVRINSDGSIEGYVTTIPEYVKKYQPGSSLSMYFYAITDAKPKTSGTFSGVNQYPNQKEQKGIGAGAYLTFSTKKAKTVNLKIGLSYTSIENAKLNLRSEASNLIFDQAKEKAFKTWDEYLSRISVETDNENDKIKFYTGLFHALLGRGWSC